MPEKITMTVRDILPVLDALRSLVFESEFPFRVSWKISRLVKILEDAAAHLFERLGMVLGPEWQNVADLTDEQAVIYEAVMEQPVEFGDKIEYDWDGWTDSRTVLTPAQASALQMVLVQAKTDTSED